MLTEPGSRTVNSIVTQWGELLDDVFAYAVAADGRPPAVILVSPVPLDPARRRFAEEMILFDADSVAKSRALAAAYNDIAEQRNLTFLDAGGVTRTGGDGVHLTAQGHSALADVLAELISGS